jgi:Flp pilus assembly protein TadG
MNLEPHSVSISKKRAHMPVKTSTKAMFAPLCRRARELRAANGGNIAVIFALALVPLIGFIGAAVDYGHANSVKVALQRALDATALMLAKNADTQTNDEMQATASSFFGAMLNRNEAIDPKVTVNYTPGNATVVLTATTSIKTDFMGLMGFKTLDIRTTATAAWGKNSLLRVALVLDNTGSMSSAGKMVAMQTAAKNMLSKLSSAAKTNGDVYVSIIPFVKDVNLGPGNYSQSWLLWDDGTDISWDGGKGSCSKSGFTPRSQCKGQGNCSISAQTSQPSCTAAGTCSISGNTTQNSCTAARQCTVGGWNTASACQNHGGTWASGQWTPGVWTPETWTSASHNTWNGCVVDRGDATGPSSGNYDTNAVGPTTSIPSTLYVPENYSSCPQAVMGLNYNWSAMTTLINNMTPAGNTNQGIGLQAGWQSLVGGGPFTAPPKSPSLTYQEHIVLLTDGLNTENRWYSDEASINTRQQILCSNIKNAGITLWAIQVNTDGAPTSTLLQNCATDPSKFFLLTSASAIISTFDDISFKITQLHLAN